MLGVLGVLGVLDALDALDALGVRGVEMECRVWNSGLGWGLEGSGEERADGVDGRVVGLILIDESDRLQIAKMDYVK